MDLSNKGAPWRADDDIKLEELYSDKNLNIIDISRIYKRTPGAISARLKQLSIINDRKEARGYDEYINSDFYIELKKQTNINKKNKDRKNTIYNTYNFNEKKDEELNTNKYKFKGKIDEELNTNTYNLNGKIYEELNTNIIYIIKEIEELKVNIEQIKAMLKYKTE